MTTTLNGLLIVIPNRKEVEELKEGDLAIDAFGKMRKVVRIHAQRDDINGKAFVCYYTEFGTDGSMSNSMKEDELVRTVALSKVYTSQECDNLERQYLRMKV